MNAPAHFPPSMDPARSRADSAELIEALAAVAINELRDLRSTIRGAGSRVSSLAEHETFHNVEVLLLAVRAEADRIGAALDLAPAPC